MWGRWSLEVAGSLLLELLRADWSSAHLESMNYSLFLFLSLSLCCTPIQPPSPGPTFLGRNGGERSWRRRALSNGRHLILTSMTGNGNTGITGMYGGVARGRRRWIVNPVYATLTKRCLNITPSQDHTPFLACQIILISTGCALELPM